MVVVVVVVVVVLDFEVEADDLVAALVDVVFLTVVVLGFAVVVVDLADVFGAAEAVVLTACAVGIMSGISRMHFVSVDKDSQEMTVLSAVAGYEEYPEAAEQIQSENEMTAANSLCFFKKIPPKYLVFRQFFSFF